MKKSIHLVWYKRDLRLHDHAPLTAALRAAENPDGGHPSKAGSYVIPLYVIEPEYWALPTLSRRHWHFVHDCLSGLKHDLQQINGDLVIRKGDMLARLNNLRNLFSIKGIYAHEETGCGWTFERDKKVRGWAADKGIPFHEFPSNGVVRGLKDRDGWARIRNKRMAQAPLSAPCEIPFPSGLDSGELPDRNDDFFGAGIPGNVQPGGIVEGKKILESFLNDRGRNYIRYISKPGASEKFCSRLSPFLTWGVFSSRHVLQEISVAKKALQDAGKDAGQTMGQGSSPASWRKSMNAMSSRLSWRCHFIQKLEDSPAIEYKCMHPGFENLRREDPDPAYLEAWSSGQTGYPLIDACMRFLREKGWITFRMRAMLVSFASYHLWLDWRVTGKILARRFTDYEPGIHYSQLQMQSGVTGINTLRIYNPTKQAKDHDPDGKFIRQWVPELCNVPDEFLFEPWTLQNNFEELYGFKPGKDYPLPIVDHKQAIASARQKISEVRKSSEYWTQAKAVYQKLGSRKRSFAQRRSPEKAGKSGSADQKNAYKRKSSKSKTGSQSQLSFFED